MNWVGDAIQRRISRNDSVLDLGCGIMQSTLDTCPSYPPTRLQCGRLVGVDLYEPYLAFLRARGVPVVKHDLEELPLPFPDKSFDHVLLLDVLEHMTTMEAADALFEEAKRIARKKIFVVTPKKFSRNERGVSSPFPYEGLGENKYQYHHVLITNDWIKKHQLKANFPDVSEEIKSEHWVAVRDLGLKILHVWSQAGVSFIMAKYQRRLGHRVDVVKRDGFDSLGIGGFYGLKPVGKLPALDRNRVSFIKRGYRSLNPITGVFRKLVKLKRTLSFYLVVRRLASYYDVVHIHSVFSSMFFLPFKKKVVEFHGDDIRGYPSKKSRITSVLDRFILSVLNRFMVFYVSTPDLVNEYANVVYLPNPVDTEHFRRRHPFYEGRAIYSSNWYENPGRAKSLSEKNDWSLTILDRKSHKLVPYEDMPGYLERFEYYIDRDAIKSLSKTALEALALGLKVVDWEGNILQDLPEAHLPKNVADKTIDIYEQTIYGK